MASNRVKGILTANGAPFDSVRLETLSDREGWLWIYSQHAFKSKRPKHPRVQVCFDGFNSRQTEQLGAIAVRNGLEVEESIHKHLTFVVTGPHAHPLKLDRARALGIRLQTEQEFYDLLAAEAFPGSAPSPPTLPALQPAPAREPERKPAPEPERKLAPEPEPEALDPSEAARELNWYLHKSKRPSGRVRR
jgi:hypothetical protein